MNIVCCCCCARNTRNETTLKDELDSEYDGKDFWEEKVGLDPKNYIIENSNKGVYGRTPGEINGQQFVIQNCKDAYIYLLDHINTITIDDCQDCMVITGPVRTSVFIRDCVRCTVMTACQQFRARDCFDMSVFLSCATEPIIESCTKFLFGPYQCFYPELEAQFSSAGLNIFNCNWSEIYDFTPDEGMGVHARLIDINDDFSNYFVTPIKAQETETENGESSFLLKNLLAVPLSFSRENSIVPLTLGNRKLHSLNGNGETVDKFNGCALIAIFSHDNSIHSAKSIINHLSKQKSVALLRTRSSYFSEHEIEQIFKIHVNYKTLRTGPVIILEIVGLQDELNQICQEVIMKSVIPENITFIHLNANTDEATKQIDLLSGLYKMHMNT